MEVVVMLTDFSPELLKARERLPLVRPTYPITVEAAANVAAHYGELWLAAYREKEAAVAAGEAGRADGYWKREHRARGLYGAALALLEALHDET
jgi:hypothetical protein